MKVITEENKKKRSFDTFVAASSQVETQAIVKKIKNADAITKINQDVSE